MTRRDVLRDLLAPHRGRLALAAVASGVAGASAALLLATSFALLAWAARQPPVLHLLVAIVAVRALALVRAGARYGERLAGHDAALRVVDEARRWAWRRLSAHPSRLATRRAGDTLQVLVADLDHVQQLLVAALVPLGGAAVGVVVVVVGAALAITPAVGATLAAGLVATGLVLAAVAHADATRGAGGLVAARGGLTARLVDATSAAGELAALGADTAMAADLADAAHAVATAEARAARRDALAHGAGGVLAAATVVAVAVVAAASAVDGRLLAAGVGLALAGFDLVAGVPVAMRRAAVSLAAVDRLAELGATPGSPVAPRPAPADVLVALEHVRVGPAARPRLSCDLVVRPGDRVAVVGPSGSGKSTLAHVLAGLELPEAGHVATEGGAEPRDLVGLVPQAPHLLAGTIRDNLRVAAPHADDLDLLRVLDRVGLGDWLEAAPGGLDTPLAEAGHGLSAGQARRLATARALLADRRVLVLDEPTADLDAASAARVVDDVLAAADDRAVVVVTHDDRAVAACDVVRELVAGRLGPPVSSAGRPPRPPGHRAGSAARRPSGWSRSPVGS